MALVSAIGTSASRHTHTIHINMYTYKHTFIYIHIHIQMYAVHLWLKQATTKWLQLAANWSVFRWNVTGLELTTHLVTGVMSFMLSLKCLLHTIHCWSHKFLCHPRHQEESLLWKRSFEQEIIRILYPFGSNASPNFESTTLNFN